MRNIEKYENNLAAALAAYNDEMAERIAIGIDGLPFEDWVCEDEGTTRRLVDEKRKELDEQAAAEKAEKEFIRAEKEFIRNAIPELIAIYKANGWDEADALLTEMTELDPKRDIYSELVSACNCFHSGMWMIIGDDFKAVWDSYCYCKKDGFCHSWDNVEEWYKYMENLANCIQAFIDDAKPIVAELRAKKN